MRQKFIKFLAPAVFFLTAFTMIACVNAETESETAETSTLLASLLEQKMAYYRQLYPDIAFLLLQGGDDLLLDMMALDVVLGYQPSSLDYEHPAELREDLLFVSVERIWFMLQSKLPSASLFKADTPLGWQAHVCVLTINPQEVAADSIQATQHLLELAPELIQKIQPDMYLPAEDYLAFVIDHEVYHCLKSMYVGPQLMSQEELWGEYNHFSEEQGADAYALAMHIKSRDKDSMFAQNILRIRGMSLYNVDPDHLTCKALEQVLAVPAESIIKMSAQKIFELANRIKHRLSSSYDDYLQYLVSAIQAMEELGVGGGVADELRYKLKDKQADPAQVREFVENARCCLAELCGGEFAPSQK